MNEKINNVIRDLIPKKNLNYNTKNQQNVKFIFQPTKEPIMVFADNQRVSQVISNFSKKRI